jgi:hypothetical protein
MQQPTRAESPPQRDAVTDRSFIQKLFGASDAHPEAQNFAAQQPEDSNLDQRVRESGEW